MALIDMGNVKEERVAIHQVFLLRDTFPIIQSVGLAGGVEGGELKKHLRRKCSELIDGGGGGGRVKQRKSSRNKTDFPQGSHPPYPRLSPDIFLCA